MEEALDLSFDRLLMMMVMIYIYVYIYIYCLSVITKPCHAIVSDFLAVLLESGSFTETLNIRVRSRKILMLLIVFSL